MRPRRVGQDEHLLFPAAGWWCNTNISGGIENMNVWYKPLV